MDGHPPVVPNGAGFDAWGGRLGWSVVVGTGRGATVVDGGGSGGAVDVVAGGGALVVVAGGP